MRPGWPILRASSADNRLMADPASGSRRSYQVWLRLGQAREPAAARHLADPASSAAGRAGGGWRVLAQHALLTLTGAGGSGKTRLAAQLATMRRAIGSSMALCWVDLGPSAIPAQVAAQVAMAAGSSPGPARACSALAAQLADRSMLLCLDNCEHVLDGPRSSAELLQCALAVCVLATSREPLRLAGETVWTVPTLSADDAFSLFVERGREGVPASTRSRPRRGPRRCAPASMVSPWRSSLRRHGCGPSAHGRSRPASMTASRCSSAGPEGWSRATRRCTHR